MKKSKLSEGPIAYTLSQADGGTPVGDAAGKRRTDSIRPNAATPLRCLPQRPACYVVAFAFQPGAKSGT